MTSTRRTTPHPMLTVAPEVREALAAGAGRSWRSSPRSSATGCRTRTTSRWRARSSRSSATAARCRRRSPSSTGGPPSACPTTSSRCSAPTPASARSASATCRTSSPPASHGATTVASTMRIAGARRHPRLRHRRSRRRAPRRGDLDGRLGRPHRALPHRGRRHLGRGEVDPRHRPHPRGPRDPRRARRRLRHRRVPLVLLALERGRRPDARRHPRGGGRASSGPRWTSAWAAASPSRTPFPPRTRCRARRSTA